MDLQQVPFKTDCSSNTICIEWQGQRGHFDNYTVKYRSKDGGGSFAIKRTSQSKIELSNLKSDTIYEIKIYVEENTGEECFSFKTEVSTMVSNASKLMKTAEKISDTPVIYRLHPINIPKSTENIEIHEFFADAASLEERTLVLVGARGSGKSTLVNAIANYITDVSFADNFRFKITRDAKTKCTERIIVYKIRREDGFKIGFNLNIIDVPGFSDGRLESKDNAAIYSKLLLLCHSVNYIDAVCLVVRSSCRLTEDQYRIFSNILSIFGKDINYVIPLITFDGGGEMTVLDSLKAAKVPYVEHMHFRFNNAQLFEVSEHIEAWNRRQQTMTNLFGEPTVFVHFSMEKTREVLVSRNKLFQCLHEANSIRERIKSREIAIQQYDEGSAPEQGRDMLQKNYELEKMCINCNRCKQTCVDDCSLRIRFFWYFMIFLENVFAFLCCYCFFCRCCSHVFMCPCKRVYCCRIKSLHRCIGCTCSCSLSHHHMTYGSYNENDRNIYNNANNIENQSTFRKECDKEKDRIRDEIRILISQFRTNCKEISKYANCIQTKALIVDLPEEIERVKRYESELSYQ